MGLAVRQLKKEKPVGFGLDIGVGVQFLYSSVSNPQDCSKRFLLYFPSRPVQSHTITTSLGNIQPYSAMNARKLLVYIALCNLAVQLHLVHRDSYLSTNQGEKLKKLAFPFLWNSKPEALKRESLLNNLRSEVYML